MIGVSSHYKHQSVKSRCKDNSMAQKSLSLSSSETWRFPSEQGSCSTGHRASQTWGWEAWLRLLAVSPTHYVTLGKSPAFSGFWLPEGLGWVICEELSISELLSLEFPLVLPLAKQVSHQSVHLLEFGFCFPSGCRLGHLYLSSGERPHC